MLGAFDNPVYHGFPVDERLHTNKRWIINHKLQNCHGWDRKHGCKGLVRTVGNRIYAGSGSLFCTINVAFKLGIKELDVYGADMELTDGFSHFYSTKPVEDQALIRHYNNSFERHKTAKALFMKSLLPDEKINWIDVRG